MLNKLLLLLLFLQGVQPEQTPTFYKSLESDEPVSLPIVNNVADAITVTNVGCNAYANAKPRLDKMVSTNLVARQGVLVSIPGSDKGLLVFPSGISQ